MRGQDARTLFDRVSRGEEGELLFDTKDPREGNRQYSRRFLPPRRLILLGGRAHQREAGSPGPPCWIFP